MSTPTATRVGGNGHDSSAVKRAASGRSGTSPSESRQIKPPATGWFWIDNRAVPLLRAVGRLAFSVYVVLARYSDERVAEISKSRIGEVVDASPRKVRDAIAKLVDAGLVEVESGGGHSANRYRLLPLPAHSGVTPRSPLHPSRGDAQVTPPMTRGVTPRSPIQDKDKTLSSRPNSTLDLEADFAASWNALEGVRQIRGGKLTEKRRRAFRSRMKDASWACDYPKALAKFPLKCCRDQDPDSWKPDIDWFLKPDTVSNILEGKYDWSKTNGNRKSDGAGPGQRHDPARKRGPSASPIGQF